MKHQITLICCVALLCLTTPVQAQQDTISGKLKSKTTAKWFKISGNSSLTYEFYHVDTSQIKGFRPRKPTHLARFIFTPTQLCLLTIT